MSRLIKVSTLQSINYLRGNRKKKKQNIRCMKKQKMRHRIMTQGNRRFRTSLRMSISICRPEGLSVNRRKNNQSFRKKYYRSLRKSKHNYNNSKSRITFCTRRLWSSQHMKRTQTLKICMRAPKKNNWAMKNQLEM